jgi:guanine deaminase
MAAEMTPPSLLDKQRFLTMALDEAVRGARAGSGGPFGAVVVKGELVVAAACNSVVKGKDPTAHAEVEAVRLACRALGSFRLDGCDVYASCEPCPMCLFALCWARPRAVYYGAGRADAAAAGFDDALLHAACHITPARLPILVEQVSVPGANQPFAIYATLPDRIPY